MYKSFVIGEGIPTVNILEVILVTRVIRQITNGIIREKILFYWRCFADNQKQKKMYKLELSEGPNDIVIIDI